MAREGCAIVLRCFVMDRAEFAALRRDDVEVTGVAEVAAVFATEHPPEVGS